MSDPEESLTRLFRAAGRAAPREASEPPFGFTQRVLAHVRAAHREDSDDATRLLCRNMVAWAFSLVLVSTVLNFQALSSLRIWRVHDPQDQLIAAIFKSPLK